MVLAGSVFGRHKIRWGYDGVILIEFGVVPIMSGKRFLNFRHVDFYNIYIAQVAEFPGYAMSFDFWYLLMVEE